MFYLQQLCLLDISIAVHTPNLDGLLFLIASSCQVVFNMTTCFCHFRFGYVDTSCSVKCIAVACCF